jgi:hypothetical protein
MRCLIRCVTRAFAVFLLLAASAPSDLAVSAPLAPSPVRALPGGVAAATLAQDPPPAKCCFTNPGYAGTCEVQPAKDESCGQILGYLNNPMSQGKGYCGNTTLRGGWQSAVCEPKK